MTTPRTLTREALGGAWAPLGASAFLALSPIAGAIAVVPSSAALAQSPVVPVAPVVKTTPGLRGQPGTATSPTQVIPGKPGRPASSAQGRKDERANDGQSRNPSEVTALVLAGGEQRGSAVQLRQGLGGMWLVTNRHVVDGEANVCVRTADGTLRPGVTVLPKQAGGLDLALLWLPGAKDLPTATSAQQPIRNEAPWAFPIVKAAGYPVGEQQKAQAPTYKELSGLLLPLLAKPLEGGMQLATTAAVRKGMSGGGLFSERGELIGLNTSHADPLWPAPLREEEGKPVAEELNRKLELVALAIPVSRILTLLKGLEPPVTESQPSPVFRGASRNGPKTGQQVESGLAVDAVCKGYLW